MTDTHRFFVAVSDAVCEQIRATLDAAWGHPDGQTMTCFLPAWRLPHDAEGRPMLAVNREFVEFEAAAALLPDVLASGVVWEIDRATYLSSWVRADDLLP